MKIKYLVFILLTCCVWGGLNAQTSLRVLNFNTRMSGQMTNYSVIPFAELIRKYNPDFIMLQEVDFNTTRNNKNDFATQLAAELGMFPIFGKAIEYDGGQYGVAILSKYPILETANNALDAVGAKEKRTVLYADVILPSNNKKVRVACTHLDHSTAEIRSTMVTQLNSYAVSSDIPTILSGDFNAYPSEMCITTGMASWQRICNNLATFPSNPTSKIDYIFGYPAGKWNVKSYEIKTNTGISDHCALIADVEYK